MAWSIRALAKQILGGREKRPPKNLPSDHTHKEEVIYIQNERNLKYKRAYSVAQWLTICQARGEGLWFI